MELDALYTDLIMEHSRSGHNRHSVEDASVKERGHNPSCGDDITLELKLENGKIAEAGFSGHGCAISQASASIMIDLVTDKTLSEAHNLAETFLSMIKREELSEAELETLEDAAAFQNISNMPARVKCAVLGWHTLERAIEKVEAND